MGGWLSGGLDDTGLNEDDLRPLLAAPLACSLLLPFLPSPRRLYSKGRILGHKRAKRNTRPNTSLVQIEGVATKEDAQFYLGKVRLVGCCKTCSSSTPLSAQRLAYVYHAKREIQGSKVRVIWGCVSIGIRIHAFISL